MRKVHITVEVEFPDEFDSIEQLETIINMEGQKIKQQLFEKELSEMFVGQPEMDSEPPVCPHCQKKNAIHRGSKPRQLKTIFGDIHLTLPRLECKSCGKYFLLTQAESRSDFEPVKGCNITQPLRRIATLCGASWPYEQAANVIFELTGVKFKVRMVSDFTLRV